MTKHGNCLENKKKLLVLICTKHTTVQLHTFSDKGYLSYAKKNLGKNLKLLTWYMLQVARLRLVTVCGRGITREYIQLEMP